MRSPKRRPRQVAVGPLGQRAARGAATTLVAQGVRILVQAAVIVALSRLLLPRDFGLVASVTAFTGVGDLIRDFGLSSAAVQAKTLSDRQRSNLFWINSATGMSAAVLLFALAVPIANFYHSPNLVPIAQALAPVFIFDGLSTQFRAELNRQLRFVSVAIADVGSQVIAGALAIGLAVRDPGTIALVILPTSQALVELVVVVGLAQWLPGLPRRRAEMKPLVSFGLNIFFVQVLTYLSRNIDNVVVGRRFGASALGAYSRAFQLVQLPLNQLSSPLSTVAIPVLSRLQDDSVRLLAFVRRGQNLLMQFTLLLMTLLASQAAQLIPMVLGPQWRGSVPIFQILAIGGAFQTASYSAYWIFLSTGRANANLRYSLAFRPVAIALILVGSIWGAEGVAWGFTVGTIFAWPFGLWWASRSTHLKAMVLLTPSARTLVCYWLAGIPAWLLPRLLVRGDVARLAVGVALILLLLLILLTVVRPFRKDVLDVASAARLIVKRPAAV